LTAGGSRAALGARAPGKEINEMNMQQRAAKRQEQRELVRTLATAMSATRANGLWADDHQLAKVIRGLRQGARKAARRTQGTPRD